MERICRLSQPLPPPPTPPQPPSPRYTRGDEQRIKDLLRENERLTGLAATLRKQLSTDATETSAKQVELDKTAEEFRGLHKERQELIVRWQESLAATTARDAEIAQASSRFASIKAVTEAKKEQIAEAQTRLDTLLRENMEMDARQTVVNRNVGDANESLLKHTKRVDKSREDVELLKNEVLAASADLASSRAANQQWIREIEERRRQLAAAKLAVDDIKARRSSALASSSTVEEAVNKTETFLKREAVRVERLDKEVAGLREAGIKARGTIVKLREEEDVTQQGIMSANRAEKTLRESLAELDVAAAQQAKLAYNADFEIAQMERKVRCLLAVSIASVIHKPDPPVPPPPPLPSLHSWRASKARCQMRSASSLRLVLKNYAPSSTILVHSTSNSPLRLRR